MIDTLSIRCRILHLALSGELTVRDEEDEPASDLLRKINEKKDIVQTENTPYDLPKTWEWARLEDVYKINPQVVAPDDYDAAFIPMEKIEAGFSGGFSYEVQPWAKASKNHSRFADGDVAFAKISPSFENRKTFIAAGLPNGIGGGTTELIVLRQEEMLPEYTRLLLLDQRFIDAGSAQFRGIVGQQRVKPANVKAYLIPIAPFQEQKRIVAAVRAVFSILDDIDNLQGLYSENMQSIRNKIVEAGMRGQLTEQLPEDGTADDLLQQVAENRAELEVSKVIRKTRLLPPIPEDEKPFEIPPNWKWVHLSDLYRFTNGTASRGSEGGTSRPVLRLADLANGQIDTSNVREILLTESEYFSHIVKRGDLVIVRVNGSRDKVAAIYQYLDDTEMSFCDHLFCGRSFSDWISPRYISLICRTELVRKQVDPLIKTTAGQNTISQGNLGKTVIPLPPFPEQERIVERIDALFAALPE